MVQLVADLEKPWFLQTHLSVPLQNWAVPWLCTLFLKREVRIKHPCVVFTMFLTQTVPYTTLRVNSPYKKQSTTSTSLGAVVPRTVPGTSSAQLATDRWPGHCQPMDMVCRGVSAKGFETWSCTLSLCPTAARQAQSSPGKWQHRHSTTTMHEALFVHIPAGLCATSSTEPRYPVKPASIPCLYEFHLGLASFRTAWHK